MFKTITTALLGLVLCTTAFAGDYDDAWKAISQKNFKEARRLLLQATKDPASATDAYLTLVYIQSYQGNKSKLEGFAETLAQHPQRSAYLYPLWFNHAALGGYGKKAAHQLSLLNKVIADDQFNGSIRAAAHYVKAMHHLFSHDYSSARAEWGLMGALENWQLAGPFDNLMGSGFNNKNAPIGTADDKQVFQGLNNMEVTWFTPALTNKEGWFFTYAHIPERTAVVYAQTFVNVAEDTKALLNLGGNGALKVWVNDALVLSESKERVTELDAYKNYCRLKKGYNRIVVQLGYTGNTRPNFIVRLTDENLQPLKGISSTAQLQPYTKDTAASDKKSIRHFAEDFFEKKLVAEPANYIHYILLAQTYLRNERTTEARQVIEKALTRLPDNPLLKYELIQCLLKADNRTLLVQEIEWLKENDPESYINYQLKVNDLMEEEKYKEADEQLTSMKELYGEDEWYLAKKIAILGKQEKVEEFLNLINKAYQLYPENDDFLTLMFRLKKQVAKDNKGALAVYEKFLKNNYNYSILTGLADEYKEQGYHDKYLAIIKELHGFAGYDPTYTNLLSRYYFEQQNYPKSLEYAQAALKLSPFTGRYWSNVASIQEQMNRKSDAIASLRKAIHYDRTNFDARKKLMTLEQKKDLTTLLPDADIYSQIKKTPAETKYDFSYVLDEKSVIVYAPGAWEEYIHYAVKIHTQKGIDSWKEMTLGYDDDNQTLMVEKVEVVKANNSKVPAERNGNEIVFTGLEAGDAIHVKYRIQNYYRGRLSGELWDKFIFNAFVPTVTSRYTLIVPKTYPIRTELFNGGFKAAEEMVDDHKVYRWEANNLPAVKTEPYMPVLNDIGTVLHISTLSSWTDIANWYSDLSYQDVSENFELNAAFQEIFPDQKTLTNLEKAKRIYHYILTKMRYSSVSFRQSGHVPQDIAKIISTRLGDCKDFSALFVALARKAGIPAQMVLVNTRDNGLRDMVLPSVEFNHCIVLAKIDGKDYYLELTDNNLSFGSLPNNLTGALALVIPPHGQKATETLKPLSTLATRMPDKVMRTVNLTINGRDEQMEVKVIRTGHLTTGWRHEYATLSDEKQLETFEQNLSGSYKNPLKLEKLSFAGLTDLSDSMTMTYRFTVKNEVIEAGSMRMIKLPPTDVIATLDNFSADKREFPVEYWNYENTDSYEARIQLQLPAGQSFVEVPANQALSFGNNTYSIKYVREGQKLTVVRTAKLYRENIAPADYAAFKKFMNDIVEAESKYIVFK